nr:PREDICTED: hemogen isoform X2 [Lepisosteus oculatus]
MEDRGENYPRSEKKDTNDNEDGIRRRLRDRDLLRKRKAEAQEKETYQEKSRKKRERKEEKSTSSRKGRPRRKEADPDTQPIEEAPLTGEGTAGEEVPSSVPVQDQPAKVHIGQDQVQGQEEMLPGPSQTDSTLTELPSSQLEEVVVIEDLGPDEKEDVPKAAEDLSTVSDSGGEAAPMTSFHTLEHEYFSTVYF